MEVEKIIKYIDELQELLDNCQDELWQLWYKKEILKFKFKVREMK